MKKNLSALLFILTLGVLAGCGNDYAPPSLPVNIQSSDVPFTSADGRFSVMLPSGFPKFSYEKRSRKTEMGVIERHEYTSEISRGCFMINYYDLPVSVFQKKDITKMLEYVQDNVAKDDTVMKKEEFTVDGYQGVSVLFEMNSKIGTVYVRSSYVIAQPRVYNYMIVSRDKSEMDKADVQNFFNSFHIRT